MFFLLWPTHASTLSTPLEAPALDVRFLSAAPAATPTQQVSRPAAPRATSPVPVRAQPPAPDARDAVSPAPTSQATGVNADNGAANTATPASPSSAGVPDTTNAAADISPPRADAGYLDNPRPGYPALSRRNGEAGRVVLRVMVDPDGAARDIEVHVSSGFPRLDQSALAAVRRWRFIPAQRGHVPVSASVLIPIIFSLKD